MIDAIKRNGVMQGTGKPEPLKYRLGFSRRIDGANRISLPESARKQGRLMRFALIIPIYVKDLE